MNGAGSHQVSHNIGSARRRQETLAKARIILIILPHFLESCNYTHYFLNQIFTLWYGVAIS